MVKSGHGSDIRPVGFASRIHPDIQVEVIERRDLIERIGPDVLTRPERVDFVTLLLVSRGRGRHTIDFEEVDLETDRIIRIRPGQVQSWVLDGDVDVTAVLSAAPLPAASADDADPSRSLDPDSLRHAWALVDIVRGEQGRFGGDDASNALLRRIFEALHAIFERATHDQAAATVPQPYAAFRQAIERDLGSTHTVRDYARSLGYSERTLSRACHVATGLSAKGVLTQRLVLEAKRQLAHSDLTVAAIGSRLGFAEATNFHKFFVREVGVGPTEFRNRSRAGRR